MTGLGRGLLGFLLIAGRVPAAAQPPRTLLAVFAHPDDETTASGTLARYAQDGVRVVILAVTSGQKGGPGPAQALGARREAELEAACRALGLAPPILLRFMDGTVATEQNGAIQARIRQAIRTVRPQIVVTFGPDGATGHPDHIAVGRLTEAVFAEESRRPSGPVRLYRVAIPRSVMARIAPVLAGRVLSDEELRQALAGAVPDDSISVVVDIAPFLGAKRRAAAMHQSQFPAGPKFDQWLAVFGTESQEYFVLGSPAGGVRTAPKADLFADLPPTR